jgi:hypothetical protein
LSLVKNLPSLAELSSATYENMQPYQKLVEIDEIVKHKPKKINMGDSDEQALERALELSKKEFTKMTNKDIPGELLMPQEDYFNDYEQQLIEADEMKMVMEASLNEYIADLEKGLPAEPEDGACVRIAFTTSGQIFERRFHSTDRIRVRRIFI